MRQDYHIELESINDRAARMGHLAAEALREATAAVVNADLAAAERVTELVQVMGEWRAEAEHSVLTVLALQSPVASDLRRVIGALWVVADVHRMGELAMHVAEVAVRCHPNRAAASAMAPLVAQMGAVGVKMALAAEGVLRTQSTELARRLEAQDDEMDALHRQMFAMVLGPSWVAGVGSAVDTALLGRFFERFADHAVAVSRRVVFMVTGNNVGGNTTPAAGVAAS